MSAVSLYKVTNVSAGPRGIHTAHGPRYLQAGAEWVGKVSKVEAAGALSTGYFTVEAISDAPVEAEGAPEGGEQAAELRLAAIKEAIEALPEGEQGFTDSGLPRVEAINELLGDDVGDVTAAERDDVWALLKA